MNKLIFTLLILQIGIYSFSQSELIWTNDHQVDLANYSIDSYWPSITANDDTIIVTGVKNQDTKVYLKQAKYTINGEIISETEYGKDSVSNNELVDYQFDTNNSVYLLHQVKLGFAKYKTVLQKYSKAGELSDILTQGA